MDSCAIGKDGNLLDAADIVWFNDPDDAAPLPTTSSEVSRSGMYYSMLTALVAVFI
jgi:hypothetical protein